MFDLRLLYLTIAGIIFAYMTGWFVIAQLAKRNDVEDTAWGLGFVLATWTAAFINKDRISASSLLVCVLVGIWGFRLAWHVWRRNCEKPEDYRYATWRKDWGSWFLLRSFLQIFMLQGMLLLLVVAPAIVVAGFSKAGLSNYFTVFGLIIWLIGFYFESVGDAQLAHFIGDKNNAGKLMNEGLWRYTRHPNYFGEVTQWWGIWFMSLATPYWLVALVGPLTITFLILKVSGIPLLEKQMAKKAGFAAYARKTSVFIPLPPRK